MSPAPTSFLLTALVRLRRRLRTSEAAFILLAALAGAGAGLMTTLQQVIAHAIQEVLYGVSINRLSALGSIHHPWRLAALPLGGLVLVLLSRWIGRRRRAPIDVVEANALHGGRIPPSDNLLIAAQTIVSNGSGASVGLEATYAQMGGGWASLLGQWFKLRRGDLRTLVGAGAGSAVGAAFGAPLTGAFYAFEIVIGNYTPAAIAPVVAATLAAVSVSRAVGVAPYLIAASADHRFPLAAYGIYAALGLICALLGIGLMRLVTGAEQLAMRWKRIAGWRPVIGGLLLAPIAWISPQALSAGHGALHLDLVMRPALEFLMLVFVLKVMASVISLSFGFRGGLFFASLFLGSLVGQIFADLANATGLLIDIDPNDAALVGMAAFSVSVVGGPMTLAILMLEITHDFSLMGVVLAATLVSSAITRESFGYSFSTWRLHLRGSTIRSPRDIGWQLRLNAARIMRLDWVAVPSDATVAQFRARVPLGSASKAVLVDEGGVYRGIVATAAAHAPDLDPASPVAALAAMQDITLSPDTGMHDMLKLFDEAAADELAVLSADSRVIGMVSETHARRRYFEEIETVQREMFGES